MSSLTPLLPLVGRQIDLAALDVQLQRGGVTTLLGPPGVGKTHLARHFLEVRWRTALERPAFWVDLTHCAEPEGLCAALAATLEIVDVPLAGDDAWAARLARIGRALESHGPLLVVLDHFDHLAERGSAVLKALHKHAREARLLVTSRTRPSLEPALVQQLGPLDVSSSDDPDEIKKCAAVQMLLYRSSRYRLREEDVDTLAALVRKLDGLPLAIELAARRLSVLSPAALLSRLSSQLDVLHTPETSGRVALRLRDVIEESWRELSGFEQQLLSQCGVFRGGFDIAALEAVSGADDPSDLPLDALSSLLDRSLVQEIDTLSEERRFTLLESIRQFAVERLSADQRESTAVRHAEYYAEAQIDEDDVDNLLQAYAYAVRLPLERGAGLRVRLLLALEPWLTTHGAEDRLARVDDTLRIVEGRDDIHPAHIARLLCVRGAALQQLGRGAEAERDLRAALARLGEGDPELRVVVLCQLGSLHQAQGKVLQTTECYERARALLGSRRRPELEGRVSFGLGLLAHSQGKLDEARRHYEHAADRYRVCSAAEAEAETLAYLAALMLQRGRLHEARARYHDALSIRGESGNRKLTAMLLGNLAILEQEEGRFEQAKLHLERGLSCARRSGERLLEGHLLGYQGCLAHEAGELSVAQRAYEHAIAVLREVGDVRLEAIFLACCGSVHAHRGLVDAAHEAFDEAARKLESLGDEGALGAVAVHRGQLLVARARNGTEPASVRAECLSAAAELAAVSRRDALFMENDDLRFAVRVLEKAMDADAFVVEMDDEGVRTLLPPGGAAQDLSTRGPLRRLVSRLVAQQQAQPGAPLSTDDLISAAWPEERIAAESGMNRLKVALATLRKLGMRELIQRKDGGYLLDPAVQLRVRHDDGG